jgi:hypothetical protein
VVKTQSGSEKEEADEIREKQRHGRFRSKLRSIASAGARRLRVIFGLGCGQAISLQRSHWNNELSSIIAITQPFCVAMS